MRFPKSFARLLESLQFGRRQGSRPQQTPCFPVVCERCEERWLLSSPSITNNTLSSVEDEGFTNITGTISDDGIDMVSVRMSTVGGTTWDGPQD